MSKKPATKGAAATPPTSTPPATTPSASQPASVERPRKGGSYVVEAGALKRLAHTKPADEADGPGATSSETDGESASTDQDQEG